VNPNSFSYISTIIKNSKINNTFSNSYFNKMGYICIGLQAGHL